MLHVKSGVSNKKHIPKGELPTVPNIVVSGREENVYQYSLHHLWKRLNAGDVCLYGTISRTREEVMSDLIQEGFDVSPYTEKGCLRIVDFLSLADRNYETSDPIDVLLSIGKDELVPEKFFDVLRTEFQSLREKEPKKRFSAILDSVDRMVALIGLMNFLSFEKMIYDLLKNKECQGIGLLYTEFLSDDITRIMKKAAGIYIEL